jgi:hypothetical protein
MTNQEVIKRLKEICAVEADDIPGRIALALVIEELERATETTCGEQDQVTGAVCQRPKGHLTLHGGTHSGGSTTW